MSIIKIPVKYIDTTKYIAKIHRDNDNEPPTDWGNFTIVQFRGSDYPGYEDLGTSEYVTESGKQSRRYQ